MSRLFIFNNLFNKRFTVIVTCITFGSLVVVDFINKEKYSCKEWSPIKNQDKNKCIPQDLKYILLWTKPTNLYPFLYYGRGQQTFKEYNCSVNNCYVTDDRNFFGGNITKFDAVAFNVRNLRVCPKFSDLPQSRSPHQKYIFFSSESSFYYPVCSKVFEGFFNWTSTYKLDSDIPAPYMRIRNIHGDVVGPKLKMKWLKDMFTIDKNLYSKVQNKSKVAAWFVSNCNPPSGREKYVARLQKSLEQYGMEVDLFGGCGTLKCPRSHQDECDLMLERDYYFYLAMENTISPDYVTEKVLTGLNNYVVPIVFGGADYSRFLPPGSYVNAMVHSPENLARTMVTLMSNPTLYSQYFRWRQHYTYYEATGESICRVCASLNNRTMMETQTLHENLRIWWHLNYEKWCRVYLKIICRKW